MTPNQMAELHQRCMPEYSTWTKDYFGNLLDSKHHIFEISCAGFGCARIIGNEAELLILLIDPKFQRLGKGKHILSNLHHRLKNLKCSKIFLEVAEINIAAKKLYLRNKYHQIGKRKKYYSLKNGKKVDGLIFEFKFS